MHKVHREHEFEGGVLRYNCVYFVIVGQWGKKVRFGLLLWLPYC